MKVMLVGGIGLAVIGTSTALVMSGRHEKGVTTERDFHSLRTVHAPGWLGAGLGAGAVVGAIVLWPKTPTLPDERPSASLLLTPGGAALRGAF